MLIWAFLVVLISAAYLPYLVSEAHASTAVTYPQHAFEESAPLAPSQQAGSDENLPFLFAVFFLTWLAFFAYVIYMGQRIRSLNKEIRALKTILSDRFDSEVNHGSE